MDYVDLDQVLDDFEEEEKQTVSALQKHKEGYRKSQASASLTGSLEQTQDLSSFTESTSVECSDSVIEPSHETNNSPVYAGMDSEDMIAHTNLSDKIVKGIFSQSACQTSSTVSGLTDAHERSAVSEMQTDEACARFPVCVQPVGFITPSDEDVEETDASIDLSGLIDEGQVPDFSSGNGQAHASLSLLQSDSLTRKYHDAGDALPRPTGHKILSLNDELRQVCSDSGRYSLVHEESLPKRFRSGVAEVGQESHLEIDAVGEENMLSAECRTGLAENKAIDGLPRHGTGFSPSREYSKTDFGINLKLEEKDLSQDSRKLTSKTDEPFSGVQMENENRLLLNHTIMEDNSHGNRQKTTEGQSFIISNIVSVSNTEDIVSKAHAADMLNSLSFDSQDGSCESTVGIQVRSHESRIGKSSRPSSLLGLSKVNLDWSVPQQQENNHDSDVTQPNSDRCQSNRFQQMFLGSDAQPSEHRPLTSADSPSKPALEPSLAAQSQVPALNEHVTGWSENKPEEQVDDENPALKRPTSLNISAGSKLSALQMCVDSSSLEDSPSSSIRSDTSDLCTSLESGADAALISHNNLGLVAPFWIPDAEAAACMMCQTRFTVWKRRHHCRACGKVLCSICCSQKANLPYMEKKEARVCLECHIQLVLAPHVEANPHSPNPNNPSEYCSQIPPSQQVSSHAHPPVVMVPTGVLRTSTGCQKRLGEPKQVMFSDGIRPGGDLTELDGSDVGRPLRKSARTARKLASQKPSSMKKVKEESIRRSPCLIPETGLPPLFVWQGSTGNVETDPALNKIEYSADVRSEEQPLVYYAVNKNLVVGVKIIYLDCCLNRLCWHLVTQGMNTAGQSELVILLELTDNERSSSNLAPPRDLFLHFQHIYQEALMGNTIQDLGHSVFHQNFLDHKDHAGFLFVRASFQCLHKITLPEPPYLFGILLQKWEIPWAKVFPIRLMLRLGAEYRYYPCPLVSTRNRKPVFFEISHTIINLLADFRNYQYMLAQIRGVTIHMENQKTVINLPRNRYNDLMRVIRSSNEHVMAIGSSFSLQADSHLVCIQNEDGSYQTQAINIQNKPRLVTGASFVVFNGALKSSSGLTAKSSIVEDGLMVQVLPETLTSVKDALNNMTDLVIPCGPADASAPEETVELRWVDNDKNFNFGVKSYIDEQPLEGVESVSIQSPTDFLGDNLAIRWTRVYFLQHADSATGHWQPMDLSRLTEDIAQATCTALVKHLIELKSQAQVKIGLRVNLTSEAIGYEVGSNGRPLPAATTSSLDTHLIPIIHQASEEGVIMELVFNVVD